MNALYYAAISPASNLTTRRNNPFKTLDVALRVSYAQGNHAVIYITDTGRGMHHIRKSTLYALSGAGLHIISESASAQFILIDYDNKALKVKLTYIATNMQQSIIMPKRKVKIFIIIGVNMDHTYILKVKVMAKLF